MFAILVGQVCEMYRGSSAAGELGLLSASPQACEMLLNIPCSLVVLLGCSLLLPSAAPAPSHWLSPCQAPQLSQHTRHCPWWWVLWLPGLPRCWHQCQHRLQQDFTQQCPFRPRWGPRNVTFPSSPLHLGQRKPQWCQLPRSSVMSALPGRSWVS